ncbi:hypothetical protein PAXRUDRAFT_772502 [Paxillus rubicundulus Ve08.2h10]|uniref:DUF4219 domain-containing protein n=1 Tax=Paxillus rubicundulus Ve08.2h10 TaxID=930991 RepID=A0A0D0C633_9AGAM|nr:hypothetical protein PAXRUDRAFT_772502 [Paxillus rubicundulus Ve08.2h10]
MGKYNHIPTLTGVENYHAWRTDMKYALGAEDLWCHISTGTDPLDLLNFASHPSSLFLPWSHSQLTQKPQPSESGWSTTSKRKVSSITFSQLQFAR